MEVLEFRVEWRGQKDSRKGAIVMLVLTAALLAAFFVWLIENT